MQNLNLYLFNPIEDWDTIHAAGIVAETQADAEEIYRLKKCDDKDYTIQVIPITNGLMIDVGGNDYASIEVK